MSETVLTSRAARWMMNVKHSWDLFWYQTMSTDVFTSLMTGAWRLRTQLRGGAQCLKHLCHTLHDYFRLLHYSSLPDHYYHLNWKLNLFSFRRSARALTSSSKASVLMTWIRVKWETAGLLQLVPVWLWNQIYGRRSVWTWNLVWISFQAEGPFSPWKSTGYKCRSHHAWKPSSFHSFAKAICKFMSHYWLGAAFAPRKCRPGIIFSHYARYFLLHQGVWKRAHLCDLL